MYEKIRICDKKRKEKKQEKWLNEWNIQAKDCTIEKKKRKRKNEWMK